MHFFQLFTLLTSLTFFANKNTNVTKWSEENTRLSPAPNCVYINDTLMCDRTEACIIDYKEYLQWLAIVHGSQSSVYKNAVPDTNALDVFFQNMDTSRDSLFKRYFAKRKGYFSNPMYNSFPIVGISYAQALGYTKWRSDRVYEKMLFDKGLIKVHIPIKTLDYFTIEKYLSGQYFNYKPSKKIPVPRYRLPTIQEWALCASHQGSDEWGIDATNEAVIKYKKKHPDLFMTKTHFLNNIEKIKNSKGKTLNQIPYTVPVRSFFRYQNDFYHLIGNVAEMTDTEGVCKGGSWYHTLEESKIEQNIKYDKPEIWLGFRNICTWETPE